MTHRIKAYYKSFLNYKPKILYGSIVKIGETFYNIKSYNIMVYCLNDCCDYVLKHSERYEPTICERAEILFSNFKKIFYTLDEDINKYEKYIKVWI